MIKSLKDHWQGNGAPLTAPVARMEGARDTIARGPDPIVI